MRTRKCLVLAMVYLGFTWTLQAAEPTKTLEVIYQEARQASVDLLVEGHHAGTGCFIDQQGLIISALHILARPGRKGSRRSRLCVPCRAGWSGDTK